MSWSIIYASPKITVHFHNKQEGTFFNYSIVRSSINMSYMSGFIQEIFEQSWHHQKSIHQKFAHEDDERIRARHNLDHPPQRHNFSQFLYAGLPKFATILINCLSAWEKEVDYLEYILPLTENIPFLICPKVTIVSSQSAISPCRHI